MVPHSTSKESTQLNSNTPVPNQPEVVPRTSERLRFKTKLKESKRQPKRPRSPSFDAEREAIDLASRSIKPGNPAHKLLFITYLGLVPKRDAKIPPYVQLKRLPTCLDSTAKTPSNDASTLSNDEDDVLDSDIEDLDLELMFCPLDIPEIYEEITKKRFPTSFPLEDVYNISACSSRGTSESGYESSTNGIESSIPPSLSSAVSQRTHYAYKSSAGKRPCKNVVQLRRQIPIIKEIKNSSVKCRVKKVPSTAPLGNRRSLRVSMKYNQPESQNIIEKQVKSQVVPKSRNQKNVVNLHWSKTTSGPPRNIMRNSAPHKILMSSQRQRPVYIYEVPNSIQAIQRRLLALHTDLEFID